MITQRVDGIKIANRAVGDVTHTTEGTANAGVYFAEQGPKPGAVVHILQHHHAGRRDGFQVTPPAQMFVVAMAVHRFLIGANAPGHGIAGGRRQVRKAADDASVHETFIARAQAEAFNSVRKRTTIVAPQLFECLKGERGTRRHKFRRNFGGSLSSVRWYPPNRTRTIL